MNKLTNETYLHGLSLQLTVGGLSDDNVVEVLRGLRHVLEQKDKEIKIADDRWKANEECRKDFNDAYTEGYEARTSELAK